MRTYSIGGNAVTVQKNSLNITDRLSERTTASFTVLEPNFTITKGMEVVITDGTVIFAGKVFKPKLEGDIIKTVSVSCVDYSVLIDKRIVAEAYDNTLAGNIVKDLITKYFTAEGITQGTILDGPTIVRAVFNYDNGNVAMNYICDVCGFYWEVDKDKKLNFFDKSSYAAATNLTDTSQNYKGMKVEENADLYRNRQYTRGGYAVSTTQVRTFKGDGETAVFPVDLPIAEAPAVMVGAVAKTIGIRGIDTGKDFYWNKNDVKISQDTSSTKLTASEVLTVTFKGFYPIIVLAENAGEVSSRQTIEGGSGLYENVTEDKTLDSKDAALAYTNGLLGKYGFIPMIITFNSYSEFKSGQILPITNTNLGVSGSFLIESVTSRDDDGKLICSVKALDGQNIGGWERFFKELAQSQRKLVIRENEILVKLITFKDSFLKLALEDTMIYSLHQYLICGTTQYCGTGVII